MLGFRCVKFPDKYNALLDKWGWGTTMAAFFTLLKRRPCEGSILPGLAACVCRVSVISSELVGIRSAPRVTMPSEPAALLTTFRERHCCKCTVELWTVSEHPTRAGGSLTYSFDFLTASPSMWES